MATQDWSPSMFAGQSWSAWADNVPLPDENDDEEAIKSQQDDESSDDSMKLRVKDMSLFGLCPSQDEFFLVVCEKCNKTLKPQAFKQHMVQRHGAKDIQARRPSSTSYSQPISSISPKEEKTALHTVRSMPTKASGKQTPPDITALSRVRTLAPAKASSASSSVKDKSSSSPVKVKKTHSGSLPFVKVERMPDQLTVKKPGSDITKPVVSNGSIKTDSEVDEGMDMISDRLAERSVPSTPPRPLPKLTSSNIKTLSPAPNTPPTPVSKHIPSLLTSGSSLSMSVKSESGKPVLSSSGTSNSSSNNNNNNNNSISGAKSVTSSNTSPSKAKSITSLTNLPVKEKFLPCKDREYDANKHCGVWIEDIQRSCTRSLTCKTHALSLRRAVKGRCKPFDDLLKEHRIAKEALLKAKALAAGRPPPNSKYSHLLEASEAESAATAASAALTHSKVSSQSSSSSSPHKVSKPSNKSPAAAFQRLSVSGVYPPQTTVRDEPVTLSNSSSTEPYGYPSRQGLSSDGEAEDTTERDPSYLTYHPKPAAMCTFGARKLGSFCVYSHKLDFVRAAFISALEKRLQPPPHKKLCVESNLPKDSHILTNAVDPYEFMDTAAAAGSANMNSMFNSSMRNSSLKQKSKSSSNRTPKSNAGSRSPGSSSNVPTTGNPTVNPAKRKRSGSGQGLTNISSPAPPQSQSQPITNVISPLPLNTNCTNSPIATIAIPSMSLTGATIGQFSAVNSAGKTNQMQLQKNNVLGKDGQVNFVLTNLDPLTRNGCVNITSTQLGQVLTTTTTEDKNSKKSRTSVASNKNSGKIVNTIPKNVFAIAPPNIYMDGALLTQVPGSTATTNSTIMSLSTSTVTHAHQDTNLTNGIGSQSLDKNLMNRNSSKSITSQPMPLLSTRGQLPAGAGQLFTSQSPVNPLQVKSSQLNMNKKVSVQPVSITIPFNNQSSLSALGGQQTQHTFLIRTSTDESGQHQEIHLQQPLPSSSTNLIS